MRIDIECVCPICGAVNIIAVSFEDFLKWKEGGLVQDCFPYLSAEERESLISGICPNCWDDIFPYC